MIRCPKCKSYFEGPEIPPHGPVGRRCTGGSPILTPDDVAKKLETAALRVWRIMMDARQTEGLHEQVMASPITHSGALAGLLAELLEWKIEPMKHGYEEMQ